MREYANAFYQFKNKIVIPSIFNKEFYKEEFIFRYIEEGTYEIGRKFNTKIKRYITGSGMTEKLPIKYQINLKGYIFAKLEKNGVIMYFRLEDENFESVITPHSDEDGSICLGTLDETNFATDVKNNITRKNWREVKKLFNKIEKQFETINWEGAHHHHKKDYEELSTSKTDIHAQLLELCYKLDEIHQTRYTGEENDDDNYDDEEYDNDRDEE